MEKKKPYGRTIKEQYQAAARDRLHVFMLAGGAVRGAILHGTRMVNEMRANHGLGILETLTLGRAYLGVGLMAADLKGSDRLSLQINCSGPIKGLSVEGNAFGEVRGYLKRVPIPIDRPVEDFNLSSFFGAGLLSVTRHLESAKQPFTGQVELRYGNIAQDLAYYYTTSEQKPSAFNLGIRFDRDGEVTGAGGLRLQAMPQADEQLAASSRRSCSGSRRSGRRSPKAEMPRTSCGRCLRPTRPGFSKTGAWSSCATATGTGCAACSRCCPPPTSRTCATPGLSRWSCAATTAARRTSSRRGRSGRSTAGGTEERDARY
jgi:redox-regulated HSP33 family molecular chaperone